MIVTVTRRYRDRTHLNGNTYNYAQNVAPPVVGKDDGQPITGVNGYPEPAVISFYGTDAPSVDDYDVEYFPVYGRHPRVMCITYDDDDNEVELLQVPRRIVDDGVLKKIVYDLGFLGLCDGKIIISK